MNVDGCGQVHADPDDSGDWVKWDDVATRVAELEDATKVLHAAWTRASDGEDAANARADAAELKAALEGDDARLLAEDARRAESERDEWKTKCEAAEHRVTVEVNTRADWVRAKESEAAALRSSLDAADRAGLELAKQLETAERKVERCKAVLSRRYSEPGHWENPAGELCSADELEAALEDK